MTSFEDCPPSPLDARTKLLTFLPHDFFMYDVIVIGVGSMGAATCYHLASRGARVLGLEQFSITHDQGSHAGQSRIIRKAYFEHPDYVPLLARAYDNWCALERETGTQVYYPTGLLYAGPPQGVLMKGVRESAQQYHIHIEEWTHQQCRDQYPAFAIPAHYHLLFEPDAGFLTPERAILLYTERAMHHGAEIHAQEGALSWGLEGQGVVVQTPKATYRARKLVLSSGAWTQQVLPALAGRLKVTRQVIAWVNPTKDKPVALGHFPCWLIDREDGAGMYYGFPQLPVGAFGAPIGLKVALHYPGEATTPGAVNRTVGQEEEQALLQGFQQWLPGIYQSTHALKTCLYTNTPDENFVIDLVVGTEGRVAVAAGFSGHGFKFASAVGEVLADLALEGATVQPIGFLSMQRQALRNFIN
ncbi:MAG: N-methyl-L-tryptophan oxidase [Bacteroidota bacterium]